MMWITLHCKRYNIERIAASDSVTIRTIYGGGVTEYMVVVRSWKQEREIV